MVTIMDMTTAERVSDEELYGEEVLNASWLPRAVLELGLQEVTHDAGRPQADSIGDPDAFIRRLYLAQE